MAFGGSNSSGRDRDEADNVQVQLRRIDAQLDELRRESDQLETTLAYLERRRGVVETQWVDLLETRDALESELWDERNDELFATPPVPPRPPEVKDTPKQEAVDLAPEEWGLDDELPPAPAWIPPAHTWEIAVAVPTGLPPRSLPPEPTPAWVQPVDTAPIWHRTKKIEKLRR